MTNRRSLHKQAQQVDMRTEAWVMSNLTRLIIVFDPADYTVVFRGGELEAEVTEGDGTLGKLFTRTSFDRIVRQMAHVESMEFLQNMNVCLKDGGFARASGSVKPVIHEGTRLVLMVLYFAIDSASTQTFETGFALDLTHQGVWIGDVETTLFVNETLEKALGIAHKSRHLCDFCDKDESGPLLRLISSVINNRDNQTEFHSMPFSMADGARETCSLMITRQTMEGKPAARIVFLKTDIGMFKRGLRAYDRRLEEALHRYTLDALREHELEPFLTEILRDSGELVNAGRSYIFQVFPELNRVTMTHEWTSKNTESVSKTSSYDMSFSKPILQDMTSQCCVVANSYRDAPLLYQPVMKRHSVAAFLMAPIFIHGEPVGSIGFGETRFERAWTQSEQQFVMALADLCGLLFEKKRLMASLEAEKRKALEAGELKEKFLATMSHEVRNPLNAIIGLSNMLLQDDGTQPNEKQRETLMFIRKSGEKLMNMIENVLYLSKLKISKPHARLRWFNLNELISEVETFLAGRLYGNEEVEGTVTVGQIPQTGYSDPDLIFRMLINLLDNAVKFTASGRVELHVDSEGSAIVFEVTDTGIGISHENIKAIFGEFFQIEDITSRRYDGVGVGLAIVRMLADELGATVTVDRTIQSGARFKVRIQMMKELV